MKVLLVIVLFLAMPFYGNALTRRNASAIMLHSIFDAQKPMPVSRLETIHFTEQELPQALQADSQCNVGLGVAFLVISAVFVACAVFAFKNLSEYGPSLTGFLCSATALGFLIIGIDKLRSHSSVSGKR